MSSFPAVNVVIGEGKISTISFFALVPLAFSAMPFCFPPVVVFPRDKRSNGRGENTYYNLLGHNQWGFSYWGPSVLTSCLSLFFLATSSTLHTYCQQFQGVKIFLRKWQYFFYWTNLQWPSADNHILSQFILFTFHFIVQVYNFASVTSFK